MDDFNEFKRQNVVRKYLRYIDDQAEAASLSEVEKAKLVSYVYDFWYEQNLAGLIHAWISAAIYYKNKLRGTNEEEEEK